MSNIHALYLKDNLYAFMLSVLHELTPEQAFQILAYPPCIESKAKRKRDLYAKVTLNMISMSEQGQTLAEIGKIYNISESGVSRRISRYKKGVR